MRCPRCWLEQEANARFCVRCGVPLTTPKPADPQEGQRRVEVLVRRATLLRARRNHPLAITTCQQALELDPQYPWAHVLLADIYADIGHFEEAVQHLTRAAELQPGNPNIVRKLVHLRGKVKARTARAAPPVPAPEGEAAVPPPPEPVQPLSAAESAADLGGLVQVQPETGTPQAEPPAPPSAPQAISALPEAAPICGECGNPVEVGARFCHTCGRPLTRPRALEIPVPAAANLSPTKLIVYAIAAVMVFSTFLPWLTLGAQISFGFGALRAGASVNIWGLGSLSTREAADARGAVTGICFVLSILSVPALAIALERERKRAVRAGGMLWMSLLGIGSSLWFAHNQTSGTPANPGVGLYLYVLACVALFLVSLYAFTEPERAPT